MVQLACPGGHFVHLNCAKQRLHVGCPGPALTFDYLFCPLCGSGKEGRCGNIQVMTAQPHLPCQLQAELARPLELRCGIEQAAPVMQCTVVMSQAQMSAGSVHQRSYMIEAARHAGCMVVVLDNIGLGTATSSLSQAGEHTAW